jgi:hypothetical protein
LLLFTIAIAQRELARQCRKGPRLKSRRLSYRLRPTAIGFETSQECHSRTSVLEHLI